MGGRSSALVEAENKYYSDDVSPLLISEQETSKLHGVLMIWQHIPHVEYVVHYGFLEKQGQFNKSLRSRFFILTSTQKLYYYSIERGSEICLYKVDSTKGSATELGHPSRVKILQQKAHRKYYRGVIDISTGRQIHYDISTANEFTFVSPSRKYRLRASDEDSVCVWIKKIREVAAGRYCVTIRQYPENIQAQTEEDSDLKLRMTSSPYDGAGKLDETPGEWYAVKENTVVRQQRQLSSPQVRILTAGLKVRVVEIFGRRARIDDPVEGWTSLASAEGIVILEKLHGYIEQKREPKPSFL